MAVLDQNALLMCKDENGNKYLLYPITKLECVDGAENLLRFDEAQELTDSEKEQARKNIGAMVAPAANYSGKGKFLKVTAVDNNGNITAVEAANPEKQPVSMIEGLADIAKTGNYQDLINKPFGTIFVVPDGEYTFVKEDPEVNTYFSSTAIRETLVLGESYIVTWDGVEHTCVAKDISNIIEGLAGLLYLGNATKFFAAGMGEDTGEPFIFWSGADNMAGGFETDNTSASHTISVRPRNNIRKIDSAYLPDDYGGSGITAADVTAMLASAGVVVPVAVEDNLLLTNSDGDIYTL